MHFEAHFITFKTQQFELEYRDGTGFPLDLDAFTGVLVERTTVVLESGVHGRHLHDGAAELVQRLDQGTHGHVHRTGGDHLAVGVAGVGALAQLGGHLIALVRLQQILGELGGLTEADRQHAGRQGIQGAGVAGLGRVVDPLDLLQHIVGSQTGRLVQQQDTVYVTALETTSSRHLRLCPQ